MHIFRASAGLAVTAAALVAVSGSATAAPAVRPPRQSAPVNAALPAVSGTARQGQTLTASSGSWGGTLPISYAYQWQRCNAGGSGCNSISGAHSATYLLVSADVGHTIRVRVTATNADGSAQAFSAPTGVIADLGNAPAATSQPHAVGDGDRGADADRVRRDVERNAADHLHLPLAARARRPRARTSRTRPPRRT